MTDVKKISEIFKKYKYVLIVLVVGIGLLMIPGGNSKPTQAAKSEKIEFSLSEWEEKIEEILGNCKGVGRVKVALAVSGTAESVYAQEETLNTRRNDSDYTKDSDKKVSVLSMGSGVESPIIIRQMYPEFLGATIVCDGADDPRVRLDITQAVASLTGISTDRITIIKMKN